MAYKVIILYRLYMPSYFLGTFTEYPFFMSIRTGTSVRPITRIYLFISSVLSARKKSSTSTIQEFLPAETKSSTSTIQKFSPDETG